MTHKVFAVGPTGSMQTHLARREVRNTGSPLSQLAEKIDQLAAINARTRNAFERELKKLVSDIQDLEAKVATLNVNAAPAKAPAVDDIPYDLPSYEAE